MSVSQLRPEVDASDPLNEREAWVTNVVAVAAISEADRRLAEPFEVRLQYSALLDDWLPTWERPMRSLLNVAFGVCLVWSLAPALTAQQPRPVFEVASVRQNRSGAPGPGGGPMQVVNVLAGNTFRASNALLESIIRTAYGVRGALREDQLIGGPKWVYTDRFDIVATTPADAQRDEILLMLQALLDERFGLVVSREKHERDSYALRLANSNGRLGPDLRKAPDDCRSNRPNDAFAIAARMLRPSSGARPSFGGACEPIETLATGLQRALRTTVIDETGLNGLWDFVVAHSGLQPTTGAPGVDQKPSLFVAVQEQLGLKLERRQGPVDVLVIQSVHQPSEN